MKLCLKINPGLALLAPEMSGPCVDIIDGDIATLTHELGKYLPKLIAAIPVLKPKGTRGFSFHWSNAQGKWDVIAMNDTTVQLDGAEFMVYARADTTSPLNKPWSLKEMQYIAKNLRHHPGASGSAEGSPRRVADAFRSKVIRLAHSNPELRLHLLPLLKEAAKDDANVTGHVYVRSGLGPKTWFYAKGTPQDGFIPGVRFGENDPKATSAKIKVLDLGDLWKEIRVTDVPTDARAKLVKGGASRKILAVDTHPPLSPRST